LGLLEVGEWVVSERPTQPGGRTKIEGRLCFILIKHLIVYRRLITRCDGGVLNFLFLIENLYHGHEPWFDPLTGIRVRLGFIRMKEPHPHATQPPLGHNVWQPLLKGEEHEMFDIWSLLNFSFCAAEPFPELILIFEAKSWNY